MLLASMAFGFDWLDSGGQLRTPISESDASVWRASVSQNPEQPEKWLWIGQYELGSRQSPERALEAFQKAWISAPKRPEIRASATYFANLVRARKGLYTEARNGFIALSTQNNAPKNYRSAASQRANQLKFRVVDQERFAALGVGRGRQLDGGCGINALSQAISGAGSKLTRTEVAAAVGERGFGNTLQELELAAQQLGFETFCAGLTEEGLRRAPKPLVGFIAQERFVAIVAADRLGVEFVCSSCGGDPTPKRVPWSTWRELKAHTFLLVARAGSDRAQYLLGALGEPQYVASITSPQASRSYQLGSSLSNHFTPLLSYVQSPYIQCNGYSSSVKRKRKARTAKDGDPVNLATGEEHHISPADIDVFNPTGPSVHFVREYFSLPVHDSLSQNVGDGDYQNHDTFGNGWTHSYDYRIWDPSQLPIKTAVAGLRSSVLRWTARDLPMIASNWVVKQGATTVASSSTPHGWVVHGQNSVGIELTPPAAASGTGFNVNWKDVGGTIIYGLDFDLVPDRQVRISSSAVLSADGTLTPAGGLAWDVMLSGSVVASAGNSNGWEVVQTPWSTQHAEVKPPFGAPVSSGFVIRTLWGGTSRSFSFQTVARKSLLTTGVKYLIEPGGSRINISPPAVPTASQPVEFAAEAGSKLWIRWKLNGATGADFYEVLSHSGEVRSFEPVGGVGHGGERQVYLLTRLSDHRSNFITFHYSHIGLSVPGLTSIRRNTGQTLLSLVRSPLFGNKVTKIDDCYSRSVYFSYDAQSNLYDVSRLAWSGGSIPAFRFRYHYTGSGEFPWGSALKSITEPSATGVGNDITLQLFYRTLANGFSENDGKVWYQLDGNLVRREYADVPGFPTKTQVTIKNAAGVTEDIRFYDHDALFNVTSVSDTATGIPFINLTYGGVNPFVASQNKDPKNRTLLYEFDSFGNIKKETDPKGTVVETIYTYPSSMPLGMPQKVKHYNGLKSLPDVDYTYTAFNEVATISTVAPDGSNITSSFTYTTLGNLHTSSVPGANGATIVTTKDYTFGGFTEALGLVRREVVSVVGGPSVPDRITLQEFDVQGRVTRATDENGRDAFFNYNIAGQPLQITVLDSPLVPSQNRAYSESTYLYPSGPRTQLISKSPTGQTLRTQNFGFGKQGEHRSTSGDTETIEMTFDAQYRPKSLRHAGDNQRVTQYQYNSRGLISSIQYPGGLSEQFTSYDLDGSLLEMIDTAGRTLRFSYSDANGLLTGVSFVGNSSQNIAYSYDEFDRKISTSHSRGTELLVYGPQGQIQSLTYAFAFGPTRSLEFSYDRTGNRLSMSSPNGAFGGSNAFSYNYDSLGRMLSVTNPFGESTSYAYNASDQITQVLAFNNVEAIYQYGPNGQLQSLVNRQGGTTFSIFDQFQQSDHQYLTGLNASIPASNPHAGQYSYSLNSRFEIIQESKTGLNAYTRSFGYEANGSGNISTIRNLNQTFNFKNEHTGGSWAYDATGNPTTYVMANGASRTLSYNRSGRLNDVVGQAYFDYDDIGRRVYRTVQSQVTWFIYDGMNPVAELAPDGSVRAVNTFGAHGLISRRETGTTTTYSFDPRGGTVHRHNSVGAVLSTHTYDAYGVENPFTTNSNHSWWSDPWVNFQARHGVFREKEVGFLLAGFRFYDPERGRFINPDPIGYMGGINLYQYAKNNPIQFGDPFGLSPALRFVAITAEDHALMFLAGLGNALSFGIGGELQKKIDPDLTNYLDQDSSGYVGGTVAGEIGSLFMNPAAMAKGVVIGVGKAAYSSVKFTRGAYASYKASYASTNTLKSAFAYAEQYGGINSYRELRKLTKTSGLEVHHLIEQRFATVFKIHPKDMPSITLTPAEHKVFTQAWRKAVPYRKSRFDPLPDREVILEAARSIYRDHPQILYALRL